MQPSLSLFAFALLVLPWSATVGSQTKPTEETPRKGRAQLEAERIQAGLTGVWQLVNSEVAGTSFTGQQCAGYMIFTAEHCSLQARLATPPTGNASRVIAGFTAGTYRWSYDVGQLTLSLNTLLHGSDIQNGDGTITYEPPGTRRDYQISLTESDLILTKPGGQTRMTFRRVLNTPDPAKKHEKRGG